MGEGQKEFVPVHVRVHGVQDGVDDLQPPKPSHNLGHPSLLKSPLDEEVKEDPPGLHIASEDILLEANGGPDLLGPHIAHLQGCNRKLVNGADPDERMPAVWACLFH